MTDVVLDRVTKIYPGGTRAVQDLRLHIRDGELFVLLGPSGCGKSTILRMIAGLEEISSGELWLGGVYANDTTPRERNVSMVFQSGALYPHRSVRGNLSFPLEISRDDPERTRAKVSELAKALGIDSMLDRLPSTLSGGQRQRVAMGRAVIREPSIFLMDEPLSNLDAALRSDLRVEIGGLIRSLGVTTVYVTHDQVEALTLADRMAIMRDGVLQDVGSPQQLYDDPGTMFVAAFLSSPPINLLHATAFASQDEGIILDFGAQALTIPWTDPRSPSFMAGHGSQVVVGIRADALTPLSAPDHVQTPLSAPTGTSYARAAGPSEFGSGYRSPTHQQPATTEATLCVRLRDLEFHGHEWLAYAESGIPAIDPNELSAPPTVAATEQLSAAQRVWELLRGRRPPIEQNGSGRHHPHAPGPPHPHAPAGAHYGRAPGAPHHGHAAAGPGHHRRSDLLFRVPSARGYTQGQEIRLGVDLERIFVFGQDGRRLDSVHR
ncbi:MAG TPA: ABC transporter ATP-binding protein [Streptosporangiaceae bacterium]